VNTVGNGVVAVQGDVAKLTDVDKLYAGVSQIDPKLSLRSSDHSSPLLHFMRRQLKIDHLELSPTEALTYTMLEKEAPMKRRDFLNGSAYAVELSSFRQ
jgi:hypothetical protein